MKTKLILGVFLVVLGGLAAYAYEGGGTNGGPLGCLTSTGSSVTNATTAVPFTLPSGAPVAVQCDAAACIRVGLASKGTVTASCSATTGDVVLAANQLYDVPLVNIDANNKVGVDTMAAISSSGTANCRVYLVITP